MLPIRIIKNRLRFSELAQAGLLAQPSLFLRDQRGVIAQRKFAQGELVFVVDGPVTTQRTIHTFPLSLSHHIDPHTATGEPTMGYFLNHSCAPNAYARIIHHHKRGHIDIIARHDIDPGYEVVIDYALMEYEVAAQGVVCQCQASNCRGYLIGYKDLSLEQKNGYSYEGIVAHYLLELDRA